MLTITKRFEFDAAHRILGHEGKCRFLHGHHYVADVTVDGKLDNLGMIADYAMLKGLVGGWIDMYWDHNILLNTQDPLYKVFLQGNYPDIFQGKRPYPFADANPTAEIMAESLALHVRGLLWLENDKLRVTRVRIYETPTCWADWIVDVEKFMFDAGQVAVKQEIKQKDPDKDLNKAVFLKVEDDAENDPLAMEAE